VKRATGKMCTRRSLKLPASAAARAFFRHRARVASSGGSCSAIRRRGWTPALLRWARNGMRGRATKTAYAPTIAESWVSRFHLHFHVSPALVLIRTGGRTNRDAALPTPRAGLTHRTAAMSASRGRQGHGVAISVAHEAGRSLTGTRRRFTREPEADSRTFKHRVTAMHRGAGASRAASALPGLPRALRPHTSRQSPTSIEWPTTTRVTQGSRARARLPSSDMALQAQPARSLSAARKSVTSPFANPYRGAKASRDGLFASAQTAMGAFDRPETVPILARRVSSRAFLAPAQRKWRSGSLEETQSHVSPRLQTWATKRPIDLVWRSSPNVAAAASPARRAEMSYSSSISASRSTPAQPSAVSSRSRDATVVCATALDPALANRLADDVIRRIDHRARIERERRGL